MPSRGSQHASNAAYYRRHRDREIQRVRGRQDSTVAYLRDMRKGACADCGGTFEPQQMDFDHRDPAQKLFRITEGRALLMSRARLLAEVSKCDIVCANCHRVRTWLAYASILGSKGRREGSSRYLARKRARWRAQARLLDEMRQRPCADCRGSFPPCAMDFDHRDGADKRHTVTRMVGRAGNALILEEAAKCDIVCANCHRARTHARRMAGSRRE